MNEPMQQLTELRGVEIKARRKWARARIAEIEEAHHVLDLEREVLLNQMDILDYNDAMWHATRCRWDGCDLEGTHPRGGVLWCHPHALEMAMREQP